MGTFFRPKAIASARWSQGRQRGEVFGTSSNNRCRLSKTRVREHTSREKVDFHVLVQCWLFFACRFSLKLSARDVTSRSECHLLCKDGHVALGVGLSLYTNWWTRCTAHSSDEAKIVRLRIPFPPHLRSGALLYKTCTPRVASQFRQFQLASLPLSPRLKSGSKPYSFESVTV